MQRTAPAGAIFISVLVLILQAGTSPAFRCEKSGQDPKHIVIGAETEIIRSGDEALCENLVFGGL